ncbi:MAG TPA: hypothetical protein VG940_05925 [Gemmatimonadales bacterium]|nr:hypothetical protein [Gemmatimonadales bacterium]
MTRTLRVLAGLCVSVLAAACGGDGGPSFAGAIDTASSRLYAVDGKALMSATMVSVYSGQDISTPLPAPVAGAPARFDPLLVTRRYLARMRTLSGADRTVATAEARLRAAAETPPAGVARTCIPTVTGVDTAGYAIDVDADYIPDDLTVNYGAACSESMGGLVYTYSGKFRVRDTENGFGTYEFTATNLATKLVDGSTGDNIKDVVNGTEHSDFGPALASHTMHITFARIGTFGGDQLSVTFGLDESSSFDPDGAGVFAIGGAAPSGVLTWTLDYQAVGKGISGDNVSFRMSSTTPLHFESGCGALMTSGVLSGLLNNDSGTGFKWTWSGCAAPTLQLFGTTDGP